jgi:hypothetical protein
MLKFQPTSKILATTQIIASMSIGCLVQNGGECSGGRDFRGYKHRHRICAGVGKSREVFAKLEDRSYGYRGIYAFWNETSATCDRQTTLALSLSLIICDYFE